MKYYSSHPPPWNEDARFKIGSVIIGKMLATGKCFISTTNISPPLFPNQNARKYFLSITFAKKTDSSENSTNQQPIFPFTVPNKIIKQSVVAVLGLGFIDAG